LLMIFNHENRLPMALLPTNSKTDLTVALAMFLYD